VDANGLNLGSLVDNLANINGINIDSVTFDVSDKSDLETRARANAFQDAKAKA
jgi:uncharacterized protein YggE